MYTEETRREIVEKVLAQLGIKIRALLHAPLHSPRRAGSMVQTFANLHPGQLFCGEEDMDLMNELTGEYWVNDEVDINSYPGFCPVFHLIQEQENNWAADDFKGLDIDLKRPVWGLRANDAIILLGAMLQDHAMGRKDPVIRDCLNMTLLQYLDVLELDYMPESQSQREWFKSWRGGILGDFNGYCSMAEHLTEQLRKYIKGLRELQSMDRLVQCIGTMALPLEAAGPLGQAASGQNTGLQTPEEQRAFLAKVAHLYLESLEEYGIRREELPKAPPSCPDPMQYFADLAWQEVPELPDPGADIPAGTLRRQLFLPPRKFCTDLLVSFYLYNPFGAFAPHIESFRQGMRMEEAVRKISGVVIDLDMLFISPFLSHAHA